MDYSGGSSSHLADRDFWHGFTGVLRVSDWSDQFFELGFSIEYVFN